MERRRPTWIDELVSTGEQVGWPSAGALADDAEACSSGGARIARRDWLKLLGGSVALAGLAGCSRERPRNILPYNVTPPELTPGVASFYATSLVLDGYATGVLVETHEGRPTKIEGNPDHPASLGAAGPFEQASVLGLYDPFRARGMRTSRGAATFDRFTAAFRAPRADRGAGLRFLLEPTSSPTVARLIQRIRARSPEARFTFWSPGAAANDVAAARLVFGKPLLAHHDLSRAKVLVTLDADVLGAGPFWMRNARDFASQRRRSGAAGEMGRLYAATVAPTPTSTMADHRIRLAPTAIAPFAAALAAHVIAQSKRGGVDALASALAGRADEHGASAIAADLVRAGAEGVVVAGPRQPPEVHALAHAIHAALDVRDAAWLTEPVLLDLDDAESIVDLAADLRAGNVETLVVLGGDPAFNAPADLGLAAALAQAKDRVVLGGYDGRPTAQVATWFIHEAHSLEAWSDARAHDGTASVAQPMIDPLFGGHTIAEVLAVFAGEVGDAAALVERTWAATRDAATFPKFWAETLRRGLDLASASPRVNVEPRFEAVAAAVAAIPRAAPANVGASLEVAFDLDPKIHDGRFVDNPWLQELPAPITKLTWDNAVLLGVATAARHGIASGDVVEITLAGRRVEGPALVVAGHADGVATLHLGYGQADAGPVGGGVGYDAFALRTAAAPWSSPGATIQKLDRTHPLAITQLTRETEGRDLAYRLTRAEYLARSAPPTGADEKRHLATLMPDVPTAGEQWAMTIDTSVCTGCNACVVACQAENNIMVVGKEGVLKSREMHWIRIDSYESGDGADPDTIHQPMLCQHCERAPCEYVCPVNATVHSPDGLNEMVYNRCVGTRFCSNNCPYKVRRFNWFDWGEREPINVGLAELQRNPDVTVRERGVMEKCSYCVQRIRETEIRARVDGREIRDGEVVTACQQACPTEAIQFGSLRHPGSRMSMGRRDPRNYEVLRDLGTSPRTTYLARVSDPNPALDIIGKKAP